MNSRCVICEGYCDTYLRGPTDTDIVAHYTCRENASMLYGAEAASAVDQAYWASERAEQTEPKGNR